MDHSTKASAPVVLSPATPSELLQYIVSYQTYPTTILICSPKAEFISSLVQDVQAQVPQADAEGHFEQPDQPLLKAPIYQVAVARHIRILYIPTVTHLRAYLSVFTPDDSKVSAPPAPAASRTASSSKAGQARVPLLLAYGFLALHRDTSEWSAQGINVSAAALVEAASRHGFRGTIIEPRGAGGHTDFKAVLADAVPVLSGGVKRAGAGGGWMGRTVEIRRILGRWFRFQTGRWDEK